MDSKGFRVKGEPDLIVQPSWYRTKQETTREFEATKTCVAPDSRYSAYAAPLEDGRLVTDYRQKCVTRAPPGQQFATKQWLVHNTTEVIRLSRDRQLQNTGHVLGTADTEPPAALYQRCGTETCEITPSGKLLGIGLERTDMSPDLFGTFDAQPSMGTLARNKTHLELNDEIRYGRNTPRRWYHIYQ